MLSNKPYLLRAFYEWIVASGCTPFLLINATFPRCKVPEQFIENGEITLNIAPQAVRELVLANDFVTFQASFSGIVHIISAPVKAVLAIYAQENRQGMFFDYEEESVDDGAGSLDVNMAEAPLADKQETTSQDKKRPSYLRLID